VCVCDWWLRVGFGAHVFYHCRISPPCFLAECRKRRLSQGSFVLLFFRLFILSDLYLVFACLFSCTALFVSISQVTGCEDRLRNDLLCVGWGIILYSLTHCMTGVCYVSHWSFTFLLRARTIKQVTFGHSVASCTNWRH